MRLLVGDLGSAVSRATREKRSSARGKSEVSGGKKQGRKGLLLVSQCTRKGLYPFKRVCSCLFPSVSPVH